MPCESNAWVVAAQLATPVVVAVVGAYFAYQQVSTAKKKLRLDHYDKRFAVFSAARIFLGKAIALGKVEMSDEQDYVLGTVGATFLFKDRKLREYLEELHRRVVELAFLRDELGDIDAEEERKIAGDKFVDERRWLREQYAELETRFRPHLQLHD